MDRGVHEGTSRRKLVPKRKAKTPDRGSPFNQSDVGEFFEIAGPPRDPDGNQPRSRNDVCFVITGIVATTPMPAAED